MRFNKMENLQREKQSIEQKEKIIEYLHLWGKDTTKNLRNILSENKEPIICFNMTRKELKGFILLFKKDLLSLRVVRDGCVSINPILSTQTEEGEVLFDKLYIDTKPLKYGDNEATFKFCIPYGRDDYLTFWIDIKLSEFKHSEEYRTYETIDEYETRKAREYIRNHKNIMKTNSEFLGLEHIRFYGGVVYNYSINKEQSKVLKSLF